MASDIRLRIGNMSTTIVFNATDLQVAQILRWFISNKVTPADETLTLAQQNQYYLDEALKEIVELVRVNALQIRYDELKRGSETTIAQQANQDVVLKIPVP